MLTSILIFSLFILIPVGLIVLGLKKKDWPNSGNLVIGGFILLAALVVPCYANLLTHLNREGIIDYELYRNLSPNHNSEILFVPVYLLLALGIIGLVTKGADSRSFAKYGFIGAIIVFFIVAITAPSYIGSMDLPKIAETKANSLSIQVTLERYETDKGLYPDNIDTLVSTGFTENFPRNPYTNKPMQNFSYRSPDNYGNFTYLPLTVGNEVRGYYLIAYGYRGDAAMRIQGRLIDDHVILTLDSEHDNNSIWPSDVPFPDIKTVIESTQK